MKRKREVSTFKRLLIVFMAVMLPVILAGTVTIMFLGKKNEQDALRLVHTQMEYQIENFLSSGAKEGRPVRPRGITGKS